MKQKLTIFSFLFIASCSTVPNYQTPATKVPEQWRAESISQATVIARDWWTSFGSKPLDRLMDEALHNNTDIEASLQRVEQARAALKISGATLMPSADVSAGASRQATNAAMEDAHFSSALNIGAAVSYELDLFGRNRAGKEAAAAALSAKNFDADALALVVMSDVAQQYFTLISLRERLTFTESNLANARDILRIVSARVKAGVESDLEKARQETVVSNEEASRADLIEKIANAENALSVLLGKAPQDLGIKESSLSGIVIPNIVPQLPSVLVQRRPDIRAAEQNLIAANADIGVARAAYFPTISIGLNASAGRAGFGTPSSTAASLVSSLTAPIFHGGQIEGGIEQATARQKELVANYKNTVFTALKEVEDALTAVKIADQREKTLKRSLASARRAYMLSKRRYDAGSIDFATLLDAQNDLLSADDNYAQARLSQLNAAVVLYKGLGGGWAQ